MFIVHTIMDPDFRLVPDLNKTSDPFIRYNPSYFMLTDEEFQNLLKHPEVEKRVKRGKDVEIPAKRLGLVVKQGEEVFGIETLVLPVATEPKIKCYWLMKYAKEHYPVPIFMNDPRPPRISPSAQKRKSSSKEPDLITIDDDYPMPPPQKKYCLQDVLEENFELKIQVENQRKEIEEMKAKFEALEKSMEQKFTQIVTRIGKDREDINVDINRVNTNLKADIARIDQTAVFRPPVQPVVVRAPAPPAKKKNNKKNNKKK